VETDAAWLRASLRVSQASFAFGGHRKRPAELRFPGGTEPGVMFVELERLPGHFDRERFWAPIAPLLRRIQGI